MNIKAWKRVPILLRQKIYLILSNISILLLFYSIWIIKPVVVNADDFLGLTSDLALIYWIGLGLMTLCSIVIYLDNDIKNDWIFVHILIIVGLFLFAVPVFAETNTRMPWSYYPTGEVKNVLSTNHIDMTSEYPIISYRSWPALHFFSAYIIYIGNIEVENIIKYMPIFWIVCFILTVFVIGKRFKLSSNQSFLLSFFGISSFWLTQYYYSSQAFAYIEYLLLFLFIIVSTNTVKEKFLKLVIFSSMVITHILTSVVILSVLFVRRVIKKEKKFILFFYVIFIVWYIYLATYMFKIGLKNFIEQSMTMGALSLFSTTKFFPLTDAKWLVDNFRLAYLFIIGGYTIISMYQYLSKKIEPKNIYYFKVCFYWLIALIIMVPLRYGPEGFERLYIFSIIPALAMIVLSNMGKKFFISLMIILVALHIPAHYGDESFIMTYTTELTGSRFTASIIGENEKYLYDLSPYINFWRQNVSETEYRFGLYESPNMSVLGNVHYIINSRQTENRMSYVFGKNLIRDWIKTESSDLIYTNGDYILFKNKGVKK